MKKNWLSKSHVTTCAPKYIVNNSVISVQSDQIYQSNSNFLTYISWVVCWELVCSTQAKEILLMIGRLLPACSESLMLGTTISLAFVGSGWTLVKQLYVCEVDLWGRGWMCLPALDLGKAGTGMCQWGWPFCLACPFLLHYRILPPTREAWWLWAGKEKQLCLAGPPALPRVCVLGHARCRTRAACPG